MLHLISVRHLGKATVPSGNNNGDRSLKKCKNGCAFELSV